MNSFVKKLVKQGKIKIVEPSDEISLAYIKKSDKTLISAKTLFKIENYDDATALTYYTSYYLVLSLLAKCGIKSENHSGSLIILLEVFSIDNQELIKSKKERVDKQYYTNFSATKKEVFEGIKIAENINSIFREKIDTMKEFEKVEYQSKFKELYM